MIILGLRSSQKKRKIKAKNQEPPHKHPDMNPTGGIKFFKTSNIPYIEATFKMENKLVTVFAVHTIPPIGESRFKERNVMLDEIANRIKQHDGQPVILIGDLNTTPWSYFFKKLLKDTNLRNSQKGFGIQPSWPTSPYSLLIPLDHCLISKGFFVENRFVGKDIGSDHYPIILQLKLNIIK